MWQSQGEREPNDCDSVARADQARRTGRDSDANLNKKKPSFNAERSPARRVVSSGLEQ